MQLTYSKAHDYNSGIGFHSEPEGALYLAFLSLSMLRFPFRLNSDMKWLRLGMQVSGKVLPYHVRPWVLFPT